MRKIITPTLFFVFLASAIAVYLNKKKSSSARDEQNTKGSVIVFANGILKSFSGSTLTERTIAEQGNFIEPGTLTLHGKVLAWRKLDSSDTEFLSTPLAIATFSMRGLSDLGNGPHDLEKVELREDVDLQTRGFTIASDFAEYLEKDRVIKAPGNVRIFGDGMWMRGSDGFTFDLATGKLNLHGKIIGAFKPQQKID